MPVGNRKIRCLNDQFVYCYDVDIYLTRPPFYALAASKFFFNVFDSSDHFFRGEFCFSAYAHIKEPWLIG